MNEAGFVIPDDHPSLPGHFPGQPVVPGVVILDHVFGLLGGGVQVTGIRQVKFLRPLLPGQHCRVSFESADGETRRFTCRVEDEVIAQGSLRIAGGAER
ncbi:MAG: hypothetical protein P8Y64_07875 [Gammaproteobacteria bacterium]|jgi:3-hydroxyacyl-[acyl-carrier-protein] dehydratase